MKYRTARTGSAVLLLVFMVLAFSTPTKAQNAAAVYKSKCSVCHADDGSGSGPTGKQLGAKDLRTDDVQKQTDDQLNASITNGMGTKMPAYKGKITDVQIKQLVAYIRAMKKA
jgi:mono/diheme cytochrome c family protein